MKVGLGPDKRSVSCTILDAVGSIPSIDGTIEPDGVYVNKEMVHHIREGLYTWDRAGKYRVRLTTKYIREFGEITIRVPDPAATKSTLDKTETQNFELSYYQSLPENKREEISIIDPYMVEVGLGPDLRSVNSNIQDAIKSIPSVTSETFPEFVFVNEEPIFFIGNGLYSWDSEGAEPVRLTTPYIKKFGNIKVSVSGKLPSPPDEFEEPSQPIEEPIETPVDIPIKETIANIPHQATEPEKTTRAEEETVAKAHLPVQTNEPEASPPIPLRKKGLGLKGFRKAFFGMDIAQVKKAIREDFNIEDSQIETFGKEENIIAVSTDKLSESGETASVQYLFTNKKLARVNVLWGPSENTDHLAVKLVQQFLSLRFLKKQTLQAHETQLYYGKDPQGNELKLFWANQQSQGNTSRRPLSLSYMAFIP